MTEFKKVFVDTVPIIERFILMEKVPRRTGCESKMGAYCKRTFVTKII